MISAKEKIRRKKISVALKGKNNGMYGKYHSEEWKKRMSKIMKNNQYALGYKHTEEWKKKMSIVHKGNKYGFKKGHIAWDKDKELSKEHRDKLSLAKKGTKYSKNRKTNSEGMRKYWARFSKKERIKRSKNFSKAGFLASLFANPSSIEKAIYKVLDNLNIKYETQYKIGNWFADIYIPSKNLIIECNGDYWHSLPHRIKRDKKFQKYCDENNYKLIWLWESEIKENPKLAFLNAFKKEEIGEEIASFT